MLALLAALALGQALDPNYGLVSGYSEATLSPDAGLRPGSSPSFDFNPAVRGSSLSNLDSTLCINGTCVAPTIRCEGAGAGASTWTCTGDTLVIAGAGSAPTTDRDTPLLGADESVLFNSGKSYQSAGTTVGNVTTEDVVLELVVQMGPNVRAIFEKLSGSAGWSFYSSGGAFNALIGDGVGTVSATSGALIDQAWYHVIVFLDRNSNTATGMSMYINGVANGIANPSTRAGTATNVASLTIGAQSGLALGYDRSVAYAALYVGANWLNGGAETTIALDRFSRLTGVLPTVARGSAAPTVMTRASVGTLEKCTSNVTSMFLVGANWPRVGRRCDSAVGYRSEPAITNTFLQSRTLATSWTKLDAGDTIGGSVTTPHGLTSTTAGLIADATDGDHGVTQAATVTAAVWTMSVLAKAGTKNFAYLSDNTVANATGFFNLSTCVTGTKGAGARELFAWSLGNGWCLIGLSFTGTAAAHTFAVQSADDAASDKTVAGNGASVMTYFSEMQLELYAHPTSRFPTTTGTAARSDDTLSFASTGNHDTAKGSLVCAAHRPSHDSDSAGAIASISTDSNNHITLVELTSDIFYFIVGNGGVTQAAIASAYDSSVGLAFTSSGSWQTNDFQMFLAGASVGTPDTAGTIPTTSAINIGHSYALNRWSGDVSRCRIFPHPGVRQ